MNAPSPNQWPQPTPLSYAELARCPDIYGLLAEHYEALRNLAELYIRHHCGHTLAPTNYGIRELCKAADDRAQATRDALDKALLELADPDERHRLVDETDTREPGNMGAALHYAIAREAETRTRWVDHEAGFASSVGA